MKKIFKIPAVEDFTDYKKSINLAIFTVYVIVSFSILAFSSRPFETYFIVLSVMLPFTLYFYRKVLLRDLKLLKENWLKYLIFGFLIYTPITVVLGLIGSVIFILIGGSGESPNNLAATSALEQSVILGVVAMAICAPVIEELMFRRILKLIIKNRIAFYFLTSLLFGLAHIIVDFSFPASFPFIITYFTIALGWAFLYDRTNNIWLPIISHSINNIIGVIVMLSSL